jgi:hypothetical protein
MTHFFAFVVLVWLKPHFECAASDAIAWIWAKLPQFP